MCIHNARIRGLYHAGESFFFFFFFFFFLLSSTYPKRIIGALQRQLWWRGQSLVSSIKDTKIRHPKHMDTIRTNPSSTPNSLDLRKGEEPIERSNKHSFLERSQIPRCGMLIISMKSSTPINIRTCHEHDRFFTNAIQDQQPPTTHRYYTRQRVFVDACGV